MSHETALLTKRATYKRGKGDGLPGVVTLFQSKLLWQPVQGQSIQDLELAVADITQTQRAKNSSKMRVVTALGAHIFEFDTEGDATLVSTQLATLRIAPPAGTSGPSSSQRQQQQQQQQGTGRPGDLPQPLKEQLLRENADLRTMYAALVRSGVLSEAEFWAGQRDLANRQHQAQQRPGMSNVISSLISAVADGKQNQVNYTLTRQQINAILAENPAVRRAYLANVPHTMPEAQFWQHYCKHQFALHAKRQRRLKGEKAADIDDEHAAMFNEHYTEEDAHQARAKAARVAPEVNLAADEADHAAAGNSAGGEVRAARPGVMRQLLAAQDVAQQYNQHAEAALQGALAAVDPSATAQQVASTLANMERQGAQQAGAQAAGSPQQGPQQAAGGTLLEDLVPLPEQHFEQLNIHDPRRYFQNMGGAAAGPTASASSMTAYDSIEALEQVAVRPGQPVSLDLQPDVMEQALLGITAPKRADASDGGLVLQKPVAMALPANQQETLRAILLALNELMRHLWGAMPMSNPTRADKAQKLVKELQRHEANLSNRLKDPAAYSQEQRPYVRIVTRAMLAQLDSALQEYEQEAKRRRL